MSRAARISFRTWPLVLFQVLVLPTAYADVDPTKYIPNSADTIVPDTVALDLLGSPDLKVLRPGSLQSVVTDLRGFYKDGKLVPGTAVEFVPYSLASVTFRQYQADNWRRFLSRISISAATVAEGSGNKDVGSAVGVRIRFIDESDWRMNKDLLDACRKFAVPPTAPGAAPPPAGSDTPTPAAQLAQLKTCHDDHTRWNAMELAFAGGATFVSPGGSVDSTSFQTANGYFGFAFRPGHKSTHWQFLLALRYTYHASVDATTTAAAIAAQHVGGGGGRIQFKANRFSIFAEGAAGFTYDGTKTNAKGLVGLTVQFQIVDTTWIELGASADINSGTGSGPSQLFALSSLKWNFGLPVKN